MDRELMEMQYRLHQDDHESSKKGSSLNSRTHLLFLVLAVGVAAVLYFR